MENVKSGYAQYIEKEFNIIDKKGYLVPFLLNDMQLMLDSDIILGKSHRCILLKARQMGCSVFFLAIYIVECLRKYSSVVLLAHIDYAAQQLFEKTKMLINNMKVPPILSRCAKGTIEFQQNGSSMRFITARTANTLRASTVNYLHLSEFAFYPTPEKMLIAAQNSIGEGVGTIIIESTANGYNFFRNFYYIHARMPAQLKQWDTFFYGWYIDNEYSYGENIVQDEVGELNKEEIEYRDKVKQTVGIELTYPQIMWRRNKIVSTFSTIPEMFDQEYPYCAASAFMSRGGTIFTSAYKSESPLWTTSNLYGKVVRILEGHPVKDYHYVLGADTSGGTGHDDSAIVVLCLETREQVFEYNYNRINPPDFAIYIQDIGRYFNHAYLIIESNSHGLSVLALLRKMYSEGKIYKKQYEPGSHKIDPLIVKWGWDTQEKSLYVLIDMALKELNNGLKFYSIHIEKQLMEFYNDSETGEVKSHGRQDIAMAFMIAIIGLIFYRSRFILDVKKEEKKEEKIFDMEERTVKFEWFD
jgi:hypothetical protein